MEQSETLVFKVSYFWTNVFAFDRLNRYVFRSSPRKVFCKIGVHENHRAIKTYCIL